VKKHLQYGGHLGFVVTSSYPGSVFYVLNLVLNCEDDWFRIFQNTLSCFRILA